MLFIEAKEIIISESGSPILNLSMSSCFKIFVQSKEIQKINNFFGRNLSVKKQCTICLLVYFGKLVMGLLMRLGHFD